MPPSRACASSGIRPCSRRRSSRSAPIRCRVPTPACGCCSYPTHPAPPGRTCAGSGAGGPTIPVGVTPPSHTGAMSTNTLSLLLVLVALCAAAVGVAVGWWLGRGVRGESDEVLDAAVSSAVNAVLAERGATAAAVTADRDLTVRAAVDTAVKVAGARLDDRMQLGSKEIE